LSAPPAAAGDGPPTATPTAADGPAPGSGPGTDRLARIVFGLLLIACFAAFIITQRLKHTPTAVQRFELTPYFSPTPAGRIKEERISFKLAAADEVSVAIIDSAGDTVATLVHDWPVVRYKQFSLRWNGREGTARRYTTVVGPDGTTTVTPLNTGAGAPAGEYRVRVSLRKPISQHGSVLSPNDFTLVRK